MKYKFHKWVWTNLPFWIFVRKRSLWLFHKLRRSSVAAPMISRATRSSTALYARLISRPASFTGDLIINVVGNSLARAITLASMLFVTRIYAPADLGIWAIVLTLGSFIVPLATLRFELAIVIAPTQRVAAALVLVIAVCSLAVMAAVAAAVFTAPSKLIEAISGLGTGEQALFMLTPFVVLLLAAQATLEAWMTRARKFGALILAQIVQAIVTAGAMLLLPFIVGKSSAALVAAAALLGLAMGIAIAALVVGADVFAFASQRRLRYAARAAIRRFKVYPLYVVPYTLSGGLVERVLQLVLASFYSVSALGTFYVARQLVLGPAVLVVSALRQVFFGHSARLGDLAQTKDRANQVLRLLIDLAAPALAFSFIWLEPLLTVVMGGRWAQLGVFAWWTLPPASALLLTNWFDRMFDVLGQQRLAVALQLSSDVVLIGIALLSPHLGLDVVGFVAALSSGKALYQLIWLGIVLRLMQFGFGEMLALGVRACALCLFWSVTHFALAALMPGLTGLVAACFLLALSLAPTIIKLASRYRFN